MPGPKSKRKRLQVSNLGNWGVKKRKVVKDTESDKENVCIMIHEGFPTDSHLFSGWAGLSK